MLVVSTKSSLPASSTKEISVDRITDDRKSDGIECPCSDSSLCRPIEIPLYSRKEVYAFSLKADNWKYYDWSVITTVAHSFDNIPRHWICYAHQHRSRVVFTTSIPENILRNSTSTEKRQFARDLVDRVESMGGDGLNIDYESTIESSDYDTQKSLTYVTNQIQIFLKSVNPHSSLVFDFGWKPNVDLRHYQYRRLADICDYSFIMVYDTQSQVFDDPPATCIAGDNSAADSVRKSLQWYGENSDKHHFQSRNQGDKLLAPYYIPFEKLILGLPWYGYVYNCTTFDPMTQKCVIPAVPFRGAPCSDAAGRQIDYPFTIAALKKGNAKEIFDPIMLTMKAFVTTCNDTKSPPSQASRFRRAKGRHESIQTKVVAYYYDSPVSIQAKVSLAWGYTSGRLGGVGMWNADVPNYTDWKQGHEFWNAMILPPPPSLLLSREPLLFDQRHVSMA
jgi:di-N-acetylchitobiase